MKQYDDKILKIIKLPMNCQYDSFEKIELSKQKLYPHRRY